MTPEQRAEARRKRADAKNAGKPCAECAAALPAHATTCSQYRTPPVDLDDADQQEQILHPAPAVDGKLNGEPVPLTIGGKPTELYPLPARQARKFVGLVARVIPASARVALGSTGLRIGIAITEDDALSAEVSGYIARAEQPVDAEIDTDALAARVTVIESVATFQEYALLFDRLCSLNHIEEIFSRPK